MDFPLRHPDYGARTVDQQCPQIGIAALADAKQSLAAATGVLLGNKSEPGSQLLAVIERLRIASRGHESARHDRADARIFASFRLSSFARCHA